MTEPSDHDLLIQLNVRIRALEKAQHQQGRDIAEIKAWSNRWKGASAALIGIGGLAGGIVVWAIDRIVRGS